MGCDIHMHIEIRYKGKWEHYAAPSINRWYGLFGKLAGVRGDGPAIVEPKGLPNDVSTVTRLMFDDYGIDAHTPSWLNEKEIAILNDWLAEQPLQWSQKSLEFGILSRTYYFGNCFDTHTKVPDGVEGFRFVFWFDN